MKIVNQITATKLRRIGASQGQNSEVWLSHDPQLDAEIVLKEIDATSLAVGDYFSEAKRVYRSRCSRIVHIMYASRDQDVIRIAMPYYRGGSLQDIINQRSPTVKEILKWVDHVTTALRHIHVCGVVHLDVKPSNILVHDDKTALLSDFGQARDLDKLGTTDAPPMYCYHFPPEVILHTNKVTASADQYQLGLTLYRLCNGDDMFYRGVDRGKISQQELGQLIVHGRLPDRQRFLPHIPNRLRRVIRKLLSIDPKDRYSDIMEIQNALNLVDKLLDWEYLVQGTDFAWRRKTATHVQEIAIRKNATNWSVVGHTIRRDNGVKRNKPGWTLGSFRTEKQALSGVERLFREMEAGRL